MASQAMPEIVVRGRAELQAAFLELRQEVLKEVKPAMIEAAKPIAEDAHGKTLRDIPTITDRWSEYRVGVGMKRAVVYVAPKAHRRHRGPGQRPNLYRMLLNEMLAARVRNEPKVLAAVEAVIDEAAVKAGFRG